MTQKDFLQSAKRTIDLELQAVSDLLQRINGQFSEACELILNCPGRLIVSGMGKSGHIGRKLAATFASTGTPAFFVHPGEASHGDLGMITKDDVVLALSNSGESGEIVALLPSIKRVGAPLIGMTGNGLSSLAQAADVWLDSGVEKEACPLGLAPTSSTTVQLVLGDALAIALLESRGFTAEDFAFSHPGGSLGRRLLLKVSDLMHTGSDLPVVSQDVTMKEALMEITAKKLGMTTVVDESGKLAGVFTDGDLRRVLNQTKNPLEQTISQLMHAGGAQIGANQLAAEALYLMEEKKITSLVIVDDNQQPTGIIHMHDLLRAGVA